MREEEQRTDNPRLYSDVTIRLGSKHLATRGALLNTPDRVSYSLEGSPLAPGYRLDNYELLCPVAEGGMAQVWLARKTGKHGFEKLIAIKTILPRYAQDARFQRMFLDEARIAAGIDHANVAHIFDLGEEHGVLYLAMEWVDGDSLSKLLRALEKKGMPFPLDIALRILSDVCGGLQAAHDLKGPDGEPLGVVHRDVSPQNILVSSRGLAKLIDFGIAKARDRISDDTSTGQFKGKVQYMAPEQALGRHVDARADLWAVGALLYHLVTGKPPYQGENQLQTLYLLTSGQPPPPLPASVPAVVAGLLFRALSHDPEHRFQSAREMQRAFERTMREAGAFATAAEVAAFCLEHLSESAIARRRAIEISTRAAEERARVQEILAAQSAVTQSSGEGIAPIRQPSFTGLSSAGSVLPITNVPVLAADGTGGFRADSASATLGSATFDTPEGFLPKPDRRRGVLLALGGFASLFVVGFVAFQVGTRSSTALSRGTSASAPPTPLLVEHESPRPSTHTEPFVLPSSSVSGSTSAVPQPSVASEPPPQSRRPPASYEPRWLSRPPVPSRPAAPAPSPPDKPPSRPKRSVVDDGF